MADVSELMAAIYRGDRELAQRLVDAGATVDLFAAAALGRADAITHLLDENPAGVSEYSPDGWTPLHLAAFFGQPEAVGVLLARGADVNARLRNQMANLALHAAAALLLEAGSEPDAVQSGGYAALHSAAQNGDLTTAGLLLAHGAQVGILSESGQTPAELAESKGHAAVAERLRAPALQ
ncbi:MAG: ankyrin repeat domain-containing protein [Bryobacteraceae bacterium]